VSPPIRVRFAPSPTGKLHIGGARTALFNWAYARRHGGVFLLRIEDTDPERSTKEFEAAILEGLAWLGIGWDEGPDVGGPHAPYHQSQRIARHREFAARLLAEGRAYRCFCTKERLEQMHAEQPQWTYDQRCRSIPAAEAAARAEAGEPATLRFGVPAGTTRFGDLIRGEMSFENREVEDWVMVRTDGTPTTTSGRLRRHRHAHHHVFRGEEHLVNTPKQVLLYRALGAPTPEFGHLPLMLGTDRKKLSKRTGDTALQDYADKGFPREAVVNFLCLQGWALNGTQEIFSVEDLVAHFDIKDVTKAGAIFDNDKTIVPRW
jgi:glutamyl-tRNA synthetase